MKRYSFPLARVLAVRRSQEQRAAGMVAAARLAEAAAEARLTESQAAYQQLPPVPVSTPGDVFLAWRGRRELAGDVVAAAAARRAEAEAAAGRGRAAWTQAHQRVRILERLDERSRGAWTRAARSAEDRAVDDLVTSRRQWARPDPESSLS